MITPGQTRPGTRDAGQPAGSQPLSPATLAVVEEVTQDLLRQLRERLEGTRAREAGEAEYASWLRRPH